MASIKHLFHIAAPRAEVFNAVSTIDGLKKWWTVQTSGNDQPGGTIAFRFGEAGMDFKVTALRENESVNWECVAGFDDWLGTTITFQLDENDGKHAYASSTATGKKQAIITLTVTLAGVASWRAYVSSASRAKENHLAQHNMPLQTRKLIFKSIKNHIV